MSGLFDLIVIGGGPAGYAAAIRAGQRGMKCLLIEKEKLGGTCLNWGCIPTKSLHYVASLFSSISDKSLGIRFEGLHLDYEQTAARNLDIVEKLTGGIGYLLKKNKVEVIYGHASFQDDHTIVINGEQTVAARNIIIATGSEAYVPPIPGISNDKVWTNREILAQTELPKSLAIIGGGVIGIEFASIYSAFGVKVTLFEMDKRILPLMDQELANSLKKLLERRGVTVRTGTAVQSLENDGDGLRLHYEENGAVGIELAERVLVAVGRRAYTDKLNVSALSVQTDRSGIQVNANKQTSLPHIYAIGDVAGGKMLAHKAIHEAIVAVGHIVGDGESGVSRVIPECVFSLPEMASVGWTEQEAVNSGMDFKVSKFPFAANGKGMTAGEIEGFVKVITVESQIVGVHILGGHATEMIHEAAMAVHHEFSAEEVAEVIHAHPTMSEAFHEAVLGSFDKMLHF